MPKTTINYQRRSNAKINKINAQGIVEYLEPHRALIALAVIEKVGPAPRQGVVSVFNFGMGYGLLKGICHALKIPIFDAVPAVWKMNYGLGSDKELSLMEARKLFPDFKVKFQGKRDDGIAEAALLAKYGERIYSGEHLNPNAPENDIFT